MFAYCLDNPIRYRDADGEAADSYAGIAFGTATAVIYNVAVGAATGSKAGVIGAVLGAAWGVYRGIKGLVEAALD